MIPQEPLVIPRVPWPEIRSRLTRMWNVREAPHHSLIGQTRSGKSYLACNGILQTCPWDRVLFIDSKGGGDPTTAGFGRPVHRFPTRITRSARQLFDDNKPRENWFRLVVPTDWRRAREVVGEALIRVMDEGDWIVVADELRHLTDRREPGLNLEPYWQQITLRGGSRGVGLVNATQEPRWVPGSFYTQSSFYWFSRIEDEAAQKRVAEVGASRELLGHLRKIPRRWWVYTDNLDDERYWAMTTVTKG